MSNSIKNPECFFTIHWKELFSEPSSVSLETQKGVWLILADKSGFAKQLSKQFSQIGHSCLAIFPSFLSPGRTAEGWRVNPEHPEDLSILFEKISLLQSYRCQGIIFLWSVDVKEPLSLEELQNRLLISLSSVVQAQKTSFIENFPPLWLVTRGAISFQSTIGQVTLVQSSLWGFGRALQNKYPKLGIRLIDLDPKEKPAISQQTLFQELLAKSQETQVVFRNEKRMVARIRRQTKPLKTSISSLCQYEASYLIASDVTPFTLSFARWLIRQGAKRLILLSHSPFPHRKLWQQKPSNMTIHHQNMAETILSLEKKGATIIVLEVDIGSKDQVYEMFEFISELFPPVRGIIYSGPEILTDSLSPTILPKVLQSQTIGAMLLHECSQTLPIDFFLLCSSALTCWDLVENPVYCASDQFLETLARYRHQIDLPALNLTFGYSSDKSFLKESVNTHVSQELDMEKLETLFTFLPDLFAENSPRYHLAFLTRAKLESMQKQYHLFWEDLLQYDL